VAGEELLAAQRELAAAREAAARQEVVIKHACRAKVAAEAQLAGARKEAEAARAELAESRAAKAGPTPPSPQPSSASASPAPPRRESRIYDTRRLERRLSRAESPARRAPGEGLLGEPGADGGSGDGEQRAMRLVRERLGPPLKAAIEAAVLRGVEDPVAFVGEQLRGYYSPAAWAAGSSGPRGTCAAAPRPAAVCQFGRPRMDGPCAVEGCDHAHAKFGCVTCGIRLCGEYTGPEDGCGCINHHLAGRALKADLEPLEFEEYGMESSDGD
jgi:hypothetical protein